MDGNKDAAQKCMDVGNRALKEGDKARAYRFLVKAQRLDPSLPLESLLSSLSKELEEQGSHGRGFADQGSEKDAGEREASSSGVGMNDCNGDPPPRAPSEVSADQVEIVRRIRKMKDYYQVLGLNKDCSAEEIRKAYRKISLKVHPDKNKAAGADEAFKAVSKAFACLNDPELRGRYDEHGPEEAHEVAYNQAARRRSNGFVYEEMFDADEIFNSFFFGTPYARNGFQRAHFVRTHRAAAHQAGGVRTHEVHFGGLLNLLQLLPVLALILISYFPFSRPVYSLERVAPYEVQYLTREHEVPFFVKSQDFDKDYPPGSMSRRSIEAQVERDYTEILGHNCRRELGLQRWNPSMKTPNCDRLRRIRIY